MRTLAILLFAMLAFGVPEMSQAGDTPPPETRYILLTGYWSSPLGYSLCMDWEPCEVATDPVWKMSVKTFEYLEQVGEYLVGRSWDDNRQIVGLWKLEADEKVPVKTWTTTETIPEKKVEVTEERKETTRHFRVGDEEYEKKENNNFSYYADGTNIITYQFAD